MIDSKPILHPKPVALFPLPVTRFDVTDDDDVPVWYDDALPESKLAVECREPEPADPDELPGLSRPGDCVKSIPKSKREIRMKSNSDR